MGGWEEGSIDEPGKQKEYPLEEYFPLFFCFLSS